MTSLMTQHVFYKHSAKTKSLRKTRRRVLDELLNIGVAGQFGNQGEGGTDWKRNGD